MAKQKPAGDYHKKQIAKLYNAYAQDIFRYLYTHTGDKQIAEDLLSDTFLRAINAVDNFDFKQPRAWLYTIARNLLRDFWKRKTTTNLNEDLEIVDQSESLEELFDKTIESINLKKAVHSLLPREKEIITLRFIQNLSSKEVAKILQTTPENVRIIQYRALKKMRKGL